MDELIIKFTGDVAEQSEIPAYEGGQAIEGIARGFVLVGHYLVEGEIRKRVPFSSGVQVLLRPPRPGSFDAIFGFAVDPDSVITAFKWLGAVGTGVVGAFAYDLIKHTFKTVTGQGYKIETEALSTLDQKRGGDVDALTDAIEPAIRQAHNVIGHGAHAINIYSGPITLSNFNGRTKDYINSTIKSDSPDVKGLSHGRCPNHLSSYGSDGSGNSSGHRTSKMPHKILCDLSAGSFSTPAIDSHWRNSTKSVFMSFNSTPFSKLRRNLFGSLY